VSVQEAYSLLLILNWESVLYPLKLVPPRIIVPLVDVQLDNYALDVEMCLAKINASLMV
jgi:hypothetical protein